MTEPSFNRGAMLQGITIVDMTSVIFGPYCTEMLAELGADIIKVESPAGDPMRNSGAMRSPGMGGAHLTLNRGKRAVTLDLKLPTDCDALLRLIADCDVFIHNVRGPAIERLGFGYQALAANRPDLIYAHCVGYGSNGLYASLPAYDDVIQAASGATTLACRVDGDPRPRYIPSTVADKVAGLYGAQAVLAAIVHRLRSGIGQFVEIPMFECFTHFLLQEHLAGGTFEPQIGEPGYKRQLEPWRQPFPTADGWISIVPYGDANWITVFRLLGHPEIMERPEYCTPQARTSNAGTLYRLIGELTPAKTTADWVALMQEASIPAVPVRDIAQIKSDPHLQQVDFFRRKEHPTEGGYVEMRHPVHYSGAMLPDVAPAQRQGAETSVVLGEIGQNGARLPDAANVPRLGAA